MSIKEIVCSNVRKCLVAQGLSYSELNKLSNGKISLYYLKALRQNNADLPLSTLEQIAKADRAPNLGLVERFNFGLLPRFNLSLVARFNFGLPT